MGKIEVLEFLFEKSRFGEGLTKIELFEKQKNLDFDELTKIKIMKIKFYEKLGLHKEGLILANIMIQNKEIISLSLYEIDIFIEISKILFSMGKIDEIENNLIMAEKKLLLIQNEPEIEIMGRIGNLILLRMGCYWQKGELDNALFYAKFNLDIRLKLKKELDIANAYNNVGVMYNARGDLIKALNFLEKALKIYSEINSTRGFSKTGNNIGAILIQLGRLNESLKFLEKSLEINLSDGYTEGIRVASQNIGEVFWHKGEFEKAINHLYKGLEISNKSKDFFQISEILIPIIAVLLEMNNFKQANIYLRQLELIKQQEENKIILQRYFLANAMVVRKSNKKGSTIKAEIYLRKIIEDEIRYHDITVKALLLLTEILLEKFENTNNPLIFDDLNRNIEKMVTITKNTNSKSLLVDSLLIKAKIELMDFNFHASKKFLVKALRIASEYELNLIKSKILNEYDVFLKNFSFWETISKKDKENFKKKQLDMIKFQIRNFFSPKIEKYEKFEQDEPLLLMLLQFDGTFIVSQEFNEEWKMKSMKFNIFQMNLYNHLSNYINKSINFAQFENNKIIIKRIKNCVACYVYQGSSNSAIQKISKFSKTLENNQTLMKEIKDSIEINNKNDLDINKTFQNYIKYIFTTPVGVEEIQ